MRRDRVLQSFVENIWSQIGRCINCHSPERNQRQVREHGEQISWIVPRDPAATLDKLVEGGNIDTDDPDESLLVLKPVGLEDHGGGPKFAVGSRTDKNFRRFLNDYAAVVNGKYERRDQLPQPSKAVGALTGQHLRIVDLPSNLDKKLLRAEIFRWTGSDWSVEPWGAAENPINGKQNMWQSMVSVVAPRGSKRAADLQIGGDIQLPDGRYLIKIYIDAQDKTKEDRDYELGAGEFYGQVEIHGVWPPGYQPPKIIHAPRSRGNRHGAHGQSGSGRDAPHNAKGIAIGHKVPDFEVTINGKRWKLSELQKNAAMTKDGTLVLTFWCSFCHSCRHVEHALDELAKRYKGNVGVIALDASAGESTEDVAKFAKERGLTLPIALDPGGASADLFGVGATTTAVVIDKSGVLRYRGQFRDREHAYAEDALRAVLAGEDVPMQETRQKG